MHKLWSKTVLFGITLGVANTVFAANRIIIKYKPTASQTEALSSGHMTSKQIRQQQMQPLSSNIVNNLTNATGVLMHEVNQLGTGAHVLVLDNDVSENQLQQIMQTIKSDPSVQYVEEDKIVKPVAALNPKQWDMQLLSTNPNPIYSGWVGDNLQGLWTVESTISSELPGSGIIVAVIDTGYTPHQNFQTNLVGYSSVPGYVSGYQFISDCRTAGSCSPSTPSAQAVIPYQANGLDLGDYVSQTDISSSNGFFAQSCLEPQSSWHGSHVTGTVIAQGYSSGDGILGGAYGAQVEPIRVLGKCGGSNSDVINGMLWAANEYPNIANPNPANILSMSLGSTSSCGSAFQDAINTITDNGTNGVIIVAAAGNDAINVSNFSPASCQHVISVAAKGPTNSLAFYSNYGATTITASGGDTGSTALSYEGAESEVYSTIWSSPQQYESTGVGTYISYEGTSQATPHVSATVADLISYLSAHNQTWNTASIINVLQRTASSLTNPCNTGSWAGHSGGCVATVSALDAAAAFNSVINGLTQDQGGGISFTSGGSAIASFTNNNESSVAVISDSVSSSNLQITSDSCAGQILAPGATCAIDLTSSVAGDYTLTLYGASGVISSVDVQVNNPPASSSGGCTAIANGDDYSLIILLLGSLAYGYQRRRVYTKKVGK